LTADRYYPLILSTHKECEEESMDDRSRKDIRRILKTFGIQADEAMVAHLARNPEVEALKVRVILQDITEYPGSNPEPPLEVVIEDEVHRQEDS
jgi:hypothetical protein